MRRIYLDYNATTPIAPSVQEAMLPFLVEHYGNPSSHHVMGRAAREAIEDARSHLATLLGAERDEIIFTSGGTEANNLALLGVMLRDGPPFHGHLVISALEHPAVVQPARWLERLGFEVTVAPANANGIVEPGAVRSCLRPHTRLVSVMHANNEIGTLQPIREIAAVCEEHDVLLHVDAAQSVGKVRTLVDELDADLLTIAGHKMYAPKGVGALYIRSGVAVEPILHGAGQECGLRPGTENTPHIAALGRAARLAVKSMDEARERMEKLRDRLLFQLRAAIPEKLSVNGERSPRLANTLSINFPGVSAPELLARVPEICASTGSACHSALQHASTTLAAIGVPPDVARGTVRFSVGWYTTEDEIDRAANMLIAAWEGLRVSIA